VPRSRAVARAGADRHGHATDLLGSNTGGRQAIVEVAELHSDVLYVSGRFVDSHGTASGVRVEQRARRVGDDRGSRIGDRDALGIRRVGDEHVVALAGRRRVGADRKLAALATPAR
jgi:hypothetical protein